MTDVRIVMVTAPDEATARAMARTLVTERLVACANLLPGVRSIYRWAGEVCEDTEVLLVMKTTEPRVDGLVARVRALHPYDVPEVLSLAVPEGSGPYLDWVREETAAEGDPPS